MTELAVACEADPRWAAIRARAPQLAATMSQYLEQMSLSLRPASIDAFELTLRGFAGFVIDHDRRSRRLRHVRREHIEAYKAWLSARPVGRAKTISARTVRHRLGMLRVFFERVIEWGWADAPRSCPIFEADLPKLDDPLPRFLDDASAAAFMRAAVAAPPLGRLVAEVLARTGLRVGELCALEANAVVRIGATYWLKVPIGKLHNDRYLPLHPVVVELLDAWRSEKANQDKDLLITDGGRPLDRHRVGRVVKRIGQAAGVGHVHPHRLRHTLAAQAVDRGMSLEAIAALLGHYVGDPVKTPTHVRQGAGCGAGVDDRQAVGPVCSRGRRRAGDDRQIVGSWRSRIWVGNRPSGWRRDPRQRLHRGVRSGRIRSLAVQEDPKRNAICLSRGLVVQSVEQTIEDALAANLSFGRRVISLGLQGGPELDGGLEKRARLADRLEVAVEADGPGAVAVAEHALVHLGPQPAHLGTLGVGGQLSGLVVERLDFLCDREVLVRDGAVGDTGVHHGHAHRSMTEKGGYSFEAHPSVYGLGGERVAQSVRADMSDAGDPGGFGHRPVDSALADSLAVLDEQVWGA